MSDFDKHLKRLIDSSRLPSNDDRRGVEQWLSLNLRTEPRSGSSRSNAIEVDAIDDEPPLPSVLDRYSLADDEPVAAGSSVSQEDAIDRLLLKPNVSALLPSLQAILASGAPDEVASAELAELVGFEELELVGEVISHRKASAARLGTLLADSEAKGDSASTPTYGTHLQTAKRKGKKPQNSRPETPTTINFDPAAVQARIEETLRKNAARPLFTGTNHAIPQEILPHVYTSSSLTNVISETGSKYLLPIDTRRINTDEYEEVIVPPAKPVPPRASEHLIGVGKLDDLCQNSFPGYATLNRIQSIVYPTAYGTNENMLICAPTGAGKTDVAMLSILHVLNDFRVQDKAKASIAAQIQRDLFKIIYVAPMKALASEITRKLGKRLKWLNILVRELTGDMQMSKAEIAETQIIVTTPEKWDVVTRKPTGEGELASKVKLLIIDEVHLLNDERGAVIETIVARTLRQVESSQSMIRIVGLSATLPNYIDIADFLRVSRQTGLFYFDSSFRPVPLEQHFLGIRGKPGSARAKKNLEAIAYEKVSELVAQGHQVMVFVHARKETVKTALAMKEAAFAEGAIDDFSCAEDSQFTFYQKEIAQSRNKEMKELFQYGFGIHHAGMLRSDRNLMEKLFGARAIKVLCTTATLAWGVNLPAHAVLIKGTQVYDSGQGKFVDISVLDVLQIFGRAGRPGMETSGEGYICTDIDKIDHYLDAVTAQHPIESKFVTGMTDSLNAEISLGTVANVAEAVQWIGYTYLFVRLRKNPRYHGISFEEILSDPQLGRKRRELVISKATELAAAKMITFDTDRDVFQPTDLGRIAAKYYIRTQTIVIFNENLRPKMSEADLLHMLCKSTEFEQIQLRENEVNELSALVADENIVPCQVKDAVKTSQSKVNILLQSFISRVAPEDFALVSDMAYVAQNAGRIIRALLEIAISRKWAGVSCVLMSLSKAVEKRVWPFDHPFAQVGDTLKMDVMRGLTRWADDYEIYDLAQMSASEIGKLIHMNEGHGAAVLRLAKEFPTLEVTFKLRPLTSDLLRVSTHIQRAFTWGPKRKDSIEPFFVWIEDAEGNDILQMTNIIFRQSTEHVDVDFVVRMNSLTKTLGLTLRYMSDRWIGAEHEVPIILDSLVPPSPFDDFTALQRIPTLDFSILKKSALQWEFGNRFPSLNLIQTHAFWSFMSSDHNALLSAPVGSGKSVLAITLLAKNMLDANEGSAWSLVVAPNRAIAAGIVSQCRPIFSSLGLVLDVLTDATPLRSRKEKVLYIGTPLLLLAKLRQRSLNPLLKNLQIVVCEALELLDPSYELAVSILLRATQYERTKFVGLTASVADASGLASWLRVPPLTMSCFLPKDREQLLTTSVQTFTIPHSASLFKAMARPTHAAISSSGGDTSLVFVPSRHQCKMVANDLITQCAMDLKMQGYLPVQLSPIDIEPYTARLHDTSLADLVHHGIGIYHDGLSRPDRALMLELVAEGIVCALVVARDALWSVPIRAGVVVAMGTQYVRKEGEQRRDGALHDRQLGNYDLAELVHMQGRAVRHGREGGFHLLCQAEGHATTVHFLEEGLPLESSLHEEPLLLEWLREQWHEGTLDANDKQTTMDILSWTYLSRRMETNPMYYDAVADELATSLSRVVDQLHAN